MLLCSECKDDDPGINSLILVIVLTIIFRLCIRAYCVRHLAWPLQGSGVPQRIAFEYFSEDEQQMELGLCHQLAALADKHWPHYPWILWQRPT